MMSKSDEPTTQGAGRVSSPGSGIAPGENQEVEPAGDGHGKTTIAEAVVTKIAALAAREIEGVESLGGAISGALAGVVGRARSAEHRTAGVGVEVGTKQAAVELTMKVRYPYPIHEVAEAVRQNVMDRIEAMTGLDVVEVNIAVTDLAFEGDNDSDRAASDRVA